MNIAGSGTPYWYEWEIGLLECLKMMRDSNIQSVILQSEDFVSLDDVVVNYIDGTITNIQVKHTDVEDNFTYSTLTNGDKPMLEKWIKEWSEIRKTHNIREIRIVTNRKWGNRISGTKCSFKQFIEDVWPKFQLDYRYQSKVKSENEALDWFKKQIKCLNQDSFEFVKILNFYQEMDLSDVELEIRKCVSKLLGTDKKEAIDRATNSLLAKLSLWSTSQRKQQEIFREDIYNALCVASKIIPNYELYPEKPIFPSRETFAREFIEKIKNSHEKIIFLQGLPGSGKTNFVSYLAQLTDSIVDFRFYTYLPVSKEYPTFSDDEGYYTGDLLWRSLLHQLKEGFEKHNLLYKFDFPLIFDYLSITEMREKVLSFLPKYAEVLGRTCYLFIDGLDHAARSYNSRNSFLYQLPFPNEINGNVKFILVGQPVNDKYPSGLINNNQIEYIVLPVLNELDVNMLLFNESIDIPNVDRVSLTKSIIEVVGNNALNILFSIREIKRFKESYTFDSIISFLQERNLNNQIDRYYDWIVSSVTNGGILLLKIKIIFAFTSQKTKVSDIARMCGEKSEEVVYILNQLYPIITCDSDEYYVFHNDVRLFFKELMVSHSNYEQLALSIYNNIMVYEELDRYKYDIAFDMLYIMHDKQHVFELFSTKYIIKSIQYNVSVNKLIRQFNSLAKLMIENDSLEYVDKISFAALTISQYINNIQYNEKDDLIYDAEFILRKTESEKYILSIKDKMNTIVKDIYVLLKKGQRLRAKKVYDEYLSLIKLDDYLILNWDSIKNECIEQVGYICRFFSRNIMELKDEVGHNKYIHYVKGWLDASSHFVDEEEIYKTFTFKYYQYDFLNNYTKRVCGEKRLNKKSFDVLSEIYVNGSHNITISSIIDLCVYGLFNGYNVEKLQQMISLREFEILESDEFEIKVDKIIYWVKCCFCLYEKYKHYDNIPQLYLDILEQNHIKDKDRGYTPAIEQFKLFKIICKDYFEGNLDNDIQIEMIYRTVYFDRQYGVGACIDCNAISIMKFLKSILYYTYARKTEKDLLNLCRKIKDLFLFANACYICELSELFYLSKDEKDFLDIAEYWCGSEGILWYNSYDNVEYIGRNIVNILLKFNKKERANVIEKCILFKLLGYVNHKDYSLNGLLKCYECLPQSETKLHKYGMSLLAISDKACSIGDNRMSSRIESALFDTAIDLGVKHINALYEFKNNPKEFYHWRQCFLDAYYKKLINEELMDCELLALYEIVNAWINENIECSNRYGDNRTDYLRKYNYKIIENIKDIKLYEKLKSYHKHFSKINKESDGEVKKYSENDKLFLDEICKNGYDDQIEKKIVSTFSNVYCSQVQLLLTIGNIINLDNNKFVSNCVVEYIIRKRKYGYHFEGLDELIERYYMFFTQDDWMKLFINIIDSPSLSNVEEFYYVSNDIEILCLYYFRGTNSHKLTNLYNAKLETHWDWLTSCGITNMTSYELFVNDSINSLMDFSNYHLGKNTVLEID